MAPDEPAAPEPGTGEAGAGSGRAERAEPRAETIEQLFREHNEALVRFLAAKLQSVQEARDVAQEAYLRLLNMNTGTAVGHLRAFLFKTAANIAIDRLRTRQYEARTVDAGFFDEQPGDLPPERKLAASQELQLVASFLEELPARCRHAFLLRRLHGLSAQEISEQMDIPLRTIRHYVVEALVYCRVRLDEELKKALNEGVAPGQALEDGEDDTGTVEGSEEGPAKQ